MVRAIAVAIIAVALLAGLPNAQARAEGPSGLTLVLVIDNSGSMANTDPGDLRLSAASQLVDLLETGDQEDPVVGVKRVSGEYVITRFHRVSPIVESSASCATYLLPTAASVFPKQYAGLSSSVGCS